jgi:hypothetical protein
VGLFLSRGQPARAQTVSIPADQVNQIVYVANAIDHIEQNSSMEKVAEAYFIVKAYQDNPGADPAILLRYLTRAQERYDEQYTSVVAAGRYRFRMNAFDILSGIYGVLASQPGSPVAGAMENEALTFSVTPQTLAATPAYWGQNYLTTGAALGANRAEGSFADYRNTILTNLYQAGRNNANAARLIDLFFRPYFNAGVLQTTAQILNANPSFRDSQNFNPFVLLIGANGSIQVTLTTAQNLLSGYYQRMDSVVTKSLATLGQLTPLQTPDYALYYQSPSQTQQAQNLVAQMQAYNAPLLQSAEAATFALPFTIERDPKFVHYCQAKAVLEAGAKAAELTAAVAESASWENAIDPGKAVAAGAKVVAATLDLAAATMTVSAEFGAFGKSDEEVIMEGVNKLSEQLFSVQEQINGRLDIIDANINTLYDTMNAQFSNVVSILQQVGVQLTQIQTTVLQTQQQIQEVQSSVDRLTRDIYKFAQEQDRQQLNLDLTTIDTYVRNQISISESSDYIPLYADTLTYATQNVFNASEIGPDPSTRQYDDQHIEQELGNVPSQVTLSAGESTLEWNLNYILEFARQRFSLQAFPGDSQFLPMNPLVPPGFPIANPRLWEMSVAGMMRLAAAYPAYYADTTRNDVPNTSEGFYGARDVGRAIQQAVANVTVNPDGTKCPLFANLILFQNLKAQQVLAALQAVENESPDQTLAGIVSYVATQILTANPTANGQLLQTYASALQGGKQMLNAFVSLGLSRSLENRDMLQSLLYSPQRLPDRDLVVSLYQSWTSGQPNPRLTFQQMQSDRSNALASVLGAIVDDIVTESAGRVPTGEPLKSVEAMLRRLDFFTTVFVSGTVTPQPGTKFVPGQPVMLTFKGTGGTYDVPVTLGAGGTFKVYVPQDAYQLAVKADKFLRVVVQGVFTTQGNIPSLHNPMTIRVQLPAGDISGDNRVDNTDLILLRNAWGSAAGDPGFDPRADINGDGVVNIVDLGLLADAFNSNPASPKWNPRADINGDGVVNIVDLGILASVFNTHGPSPNWNPLADLNGDGRVDGSDLAILRANYGRRGDEFN